MAPIILAQVAVVAAVSSGVPDPTLVPAIGLTVDACVDADREELRRLLEVEYRGPLADPDRSDLTQVIVRCSEERNEVRVLVPRRPRETVRTVDMSGPGAVAKGAKTRELALVIAELVRSAQASEPVGETIPAPRIADKVPPLLSAPSGWTQVGALFTAEKYSGGQAQLGPGMGARFVVTRYFTTELRVGARWAQSLGARDGFINSRGFVGGIGAGIDTFPDHNRAGLLLMARAEVEWLRVQGNDSGAAIGRSASGVAVVASAAPCGWVALGHSLRLLAEPAVLVPIHTLVIDDQGERVSSLSGVGVAATLGIMAHF